MFYKAIRKCVLGVTLIEKGQIIERAVGFKNPNFEPVKAETATKPSIKQ